MDYIEIIDEDGNEETFELVSTFGLKNYPDSYVIYKELDNNKFYIAKYKGDLSNLDTNLTEDEINLAKELFGGNE